MTFLITNTIRTQPALQYGHLEKEWTGNDYIQTLHSGFCSIAVIIFTSQILYALTQILNVNNFHAEINKIVFLFYFAFVGLSVERRLNYSRQALYH